MFGLKLLRVVLAFACLAVLFSGGFAQEAAGPVTFPSATQENQTVRTFETQQQQPQQQQPQQPQQHQLPSEMSNKRNDWWPPAGSAPAPEQEATQPPVHQYSPWIQQPPMHANHYLPAPSMLTGPVGQVRSEHYAYPPEYAEYGGHSVVTPAAGNSLGLGPKHLAIVSFIGLLLLFAVIQNSLLAAKRKDALVEALSGRNKRDLYVAHGLRPMTPEQEEILNDDARLRCIQRTVCLENRRIVENLGTSGEKLAKYLTSGVQRSVSTSSGWDRLVEDAGAAGLRGEDCDVLYRDCALPVTSRSRGNREK